MKDKPTDTETPPSHYGSKVLFAIAGKHFACPMPNMSDYPKTAILLDFRVYFPSTFDIKQTVSAVFSLCNQIVSPSEPS